MGWFEENTNTRHRSEVSDAAKLQKFEEVKSECHAPILKEVDSGMKPFKPVRFQPVQSPGLFEAEFAEKDGDVIFHFWPSGYAEAVAKANTRPNFKATFLPSMEKGFEEFYDPHRLQASFEPELGAYTVRAVGYGDQQFWKKKAIDVCTQIHVLMGG